MGEIQRHKMAAAYIYTKLPTSPSSRIDVGGLAKGAATLKSAASWLLPSPTTRVVLLPGGAARND